MRFALAAGTLFLASCATAPEPPPPIAPVQQPVLVTPSRHVHSSLLGMTASELISHLGNPALQVREGAGVKMQFRSRQCVVDAYLYPPDNGGGLTRVTHSDARLPSGADTDQESCISAIEASR